MRKLGINSHTQLHHHQQQQALQQLQFVAPAPRSESPLSPRHTPPTHLGALVGPATTIDCTLNAIDLNSISPLPSPSSAVTGSGGASHHHLLMCTMPLRESNIREPAAPGPVGPAATHVSGQLRDSAYFRGSTLANSGGHAASTFTMRGDCASPYGATGVGDAYLGHQYGSLLGARENSCLLSRESCIAVTPMQTLGLGGHRTPSSRFLTSGLDQRIMKQSTEDCRRLLQQATAIADTSRMLQQASGGSPSPMDIGVPHGQQQQHQQLQHQQQHQHHHHHHHHHHGVASPAAAAAAMQHHHQQLQHQQQQQQRILTSSSSFDSKSNLSGYAAGFYMSAEATRLFNTLQQSPLPLVPDVITC